MACPNPCQHDLARGVLVAELMGPADGPHVSWVDRMRGDTTSWAGLFAAMLKQRRPPQEL